jgi:hypothetical protein
MGRAIDELVEARHGILDVLILVLCRGARTPQRSPRDAAYGVSTWNVTSFSEATGSPFSVAGL